MSRDTKLTEPQIARFRATFRAIDEDGDGRVSHGELAAFVRNLELHPSDAALDDMIREVDSDGNGVLDYAGFMAVMAKLMAYGNLMSELKKTFNMLDTDGDGFITPAELRRMTPLVSEHLSQREVDEMIRTADANDDGKVSFDEFVEMITG